MIVQNQHDFVRIMKGLTTHDGKFKHDIFQFPRDGQSEGWIAWHVFLGTAL